ncbi:TPA: LPXTG cell wall anchor domain-containing protein [Streptococcus pyogenes]|nr:LPXTG cell wall anchor domain-containing protein [Streptococcus pyogenes]
MSQKGHGYLRKSKAYGLVSGIALAGAAGALLTTNAVSADEVTDTVNTQPDIEVVSESNATNLSEVQANNSQAHDELASQSGTQTGDLTNTVTSDNLNQSVSEAQKAGVEVAQGNTVTYDSLSEAQNDLNSQTQAVNDATNTQKVVDSQTAKAQEAATNSGVTVTPSEGKTYTDLNEAQADAKAQTDNLTAVTAAQNQVNEQLPQAIESATQSGVKVTVNAGAKTSDAKKALEELSKEVASLNQAKDTQTSITESMAQALNEAKKAGVTVNIANSKSYDDLAQALADAKSQVAKLTEFKTTQTESNQAIKTATDAATTAGVTVSKGETKTYTDLTQAKADSVKQVSSLTQATETQKEADKTITDLTKQAQESGLNLTKGNSKSYSSVDEAKADLVKQQETLSKAKEAKTSAEATNRENAQKAQVAQDKANQAIQAAVSKATASGTTVTNAGTIETTVEEAQKIAQKQVDKINAVVVKNQAAQADYEKKKTEVDAQNAEIAKQNAAAQAKYEEELAAKKDGYLSVPSAQSLIFQSEPNAKNTIVKSDGTVITSDSTEDTRVVLHKGESITVTYTNLEHSSYAGTKISKVVYTYTAKDDTDGLHINHDPNVTVTFYGADFALPDATGEQAGSWSSHLGMAIQFFGTDNKPIKFTTDHPALIAFNSLNRTKVYAGSGYGETIQNLSSNIEVATINGSSIVYENGVLHASGYNDYKSNGSRFETNPASGDPDYWDGDTQANRWYGAAVGIVKSGDTISFDIVMDAGSDAERHQYGQFWFAFSSNIASVTPPNYIPKIPDDITPPTPEPVSVQNIHITPEVVSIPKDVSLHDVKLQAETHDIKLATDAAPITLETTVTTPALTANVHDITLKTAVHPVQVTQKPTNIKSVINNDNVDINGRAVTKGSTVKWVLKNNKLLAGRKELTAVVMNDPFPAGFEIDNEATTKENSTYYTLKATEDGNYQLVGTANLLALLNANRNQDVDVPAFTFIGKPLNDNGHYENTFKTIYSTADGYYTVVSNTPEITTTETPNPEKSVTDKAGNDINGKTSFDKDVTFHLTTDYSPYVNTIVDVETMAKAAGIYDDTDDKTVNPDITKATVTDSNGNDITSQGTFYDIEAGQAIPAELQIFLDGAHLTPDGEFVVWMPNDLKDYYQNYVLTGNNVTVNLPVEVIAAAGEKAENTFVQVEFGNGYQSNLVFVKVPDVSPEKHAIDQKGNLLDDQEVGLHQVFEYLLDGVTVPKDHDTLFQYDGKDKLDLEHDRYTGNWKGVITGTEYTAKEDMTLPYDVITEDGNLIKAGDTIAAGTSYRFIFEFNQDTNDDFINQMVKVTWDAEKGEWAYSIDKDFLNSLGVEGTFDADFWIEVERIKDGEVENTFINTVNGRELIATVTTHTAPEPETPAPETPQPPQEVPVVPAAALPMTGETTSPLSILASLFGLAMMALGLFGIRKRNKEQK